MSLLILLVKKSAGAYYIVKVTKKEEKGSDWKKYEKRLKEILTADVKMMPTLSVASLLKQ